MGTSKLVFLLVALSLISTVMSRGTPPELVSSHGKTWSKNYDYIRSNSNATYHCMATGIPSPTYEWRVNGKKVVNNPLTVSYDSKTGVLSVHDRFGFANSGIYQCIAMNENGKAMSAFLHLNATVADTFPGKETSPTDETTYVSEYFSIICKDAPLSIPPWIFMWERGILVNNELIATKISSNDTRMLIDDKGTLHFLWTKPADGDLVYQCSGINSVVLQESKNPAKIRLTVRNGQESNRAPELKYKQGAEVRAGEDAVLTCIFTYYSKSGEHLVINWYYKGNKLQGKTGPKLVLKNVPMTNQSHSIEGEYMCEAELGPKKAQSTVTLKIVGPPQFIKGQETSKDSVPLGNDAVFTCGTTSRHSHSQPPVWLVNTEPVIGCLSGQIECRKPYNNGHSQCISNEGLCNADPQCQDKSDELFCPGSCSEGMKYCNGSCIGETEVCPDLNCKYPDIKCDGDLKCVKESQRCDGLNNCGDGSDEFACPGGANHTIGRFIVNSERTKLILPNVQLDDKMCFQCLVTNDFGTTIGDGCLTVIDKIEIVVQPNNTYNVKPGMNLSIPIEARTDPLYQNQMKYRWVWFRKLPDPATGKAVEREEQLPPKSHEKYFHLSLENNNLTIQFPAVEGENKDIYNVYNSMIDRQYAVIISHSYDEVKYPFYIEGEDAVPPTGAPVVEKASINLWFIWVILGVAVLAVVIILVVCYLYKNRGGTYMLGKKEKQAGHNPEAELMNDGFHDAGRQFADQEETDETAVP